MALKRRLVAGLLVANCAAACNAIMGIEEGTPRRKAEAAGGVAGHDEQSAGAVSAGGARPAEAGADAGPAGDCQHARWPTRPLGTDPKLLPEMLVAAHTVVVNDTDRVGRDLDLTCTCPAVQTCVPPGEPELACDGPEGRDVSINKVLGTVSAQGVGAFSEEAMQADLSAGRIGLLLRIGGYNGAADDERVNVEVFGKAWVPEGYALKHDGTDRWQVYEDAFIAELAVDWDMDGYVRDFMLVAKFEQLTLALRPKVAENANPLLITLDEVVVSGKLVKGDAGFSLTEGSMVGRWPTAKALRAYASLKIADAFLCGDNPVFALLKSTTCKYADIMRSAKLDGEGQDCDAISWALGFEAEPAILGDAVTPPILANDCGPDWQPTCFD